jgi:hypothetical protein
MIFRIVSSNSIATRWPVATSIPEQFITLPFYAQRVNILPTGIGRKPKIPREKKAVEMPLRPALLHSATEPYHDTTGGRIGWRATPAVDLGGGGRGRGGAPVVRPYLQASGQSPPAEGRICVRLSTAIELAVMWFVRIGAKLAAPAISTSRTAARSDGAGHFVRGGIIKSSPNREGIRETGKLMRKRR